MLFLQVRLLQKYETKVLAKEYAAMPFYIEYLIMSEYENPTYKTFPS